MVDLTAMFYFYITVNRISCWQSSKLCSSHMLTWLRPADRKCFSMGYFKALSYKANTSNQIALWYKWLVRVFAWYIHLPIVHVIKCKGILLKRYWDYYTEKGFFSEYVKISFEHNLFLILDYVLLFCLTIPGAPTTSITVLSQLLYILFTDPFYFVMFSYIFYRRNNIVFAYY